MSQTVQQIIEMILAAVPGAPFAQTVDTLKIGDPREPVTGIAVTFLATVEVIEAAIARGANFIITHEPTFYNHLDDVQWLEKDAVYTAKRRLLEDHGMAVWRFHDYLHAMRPDPTMTGMLRALNWADYQDPSNPFVCHLPPRSLETLVAEVKTALGLETVRVVGAGDACERVGILVGAPGGEWQIKVFGQGNVDVLLCGEINEWETNEYVRDALGLGLVKALVVLGHAASEEPGMREMVPWLQARVPEVPVSFVSVGEPFMWR